MTLVKSNEKKPKQNQKKMQKTFYKLVLKPKGRVFNFFPTSKNYTNLKFNVKSIT